MKGIFKQALSVTLLLSVVTSSVFASAPVGTPAATTWNNVWTNVRNSNAWTKTSDSMSKAYDSAKDGIVSGLTTAKNGVVSGATTAYVCVNGPKAVEYAKENKAKAAGIAAAALVGTGATVYGLKKAYRYFRPATVTVAHVADKTVVIEDVVEVVDAEGNVVDVVVATRTVVSPVAVAQAKPGFNFLGIRFGGNAPVEARSEEIVVDLSPVVSSEDASGRAYFNFVGKTYDRLTRKSAVVVEKPVAQAPAKIEEELHLNSHVSSESLNAIPAQVASLYPAVVVDAELAAQVEADVLAAQMAHKKAVDAKRAADSFAAQMAATVARGEMSVADQVEANAAMARQLAIDQVEMIKAMKKNSRR